LISADNLNLYYFVFRDLPVRFFPDLIGTIHSPFGQVLKSIRENEPRAISLGYDVDKYKLLAFVLSAALVRTCGCDQNGRVSSWPRSPMRTGICPGEVFCMTLLGGLVPCSARGWRVSLLSACKTSLADKVGSWVQVIMARFLSYACSRSGAASWAN
jgi:branched-chain amino acid transport system permease protein